MAFDKITPTLSKPLFRGLILSPLFFSKSTETIPGNFLACCKPIIPFNVPSFPERKRHTTQKFFFGMKDICFPTDVNAAKWAASTLETKLQIG